MVDRKPTYKNRVLITKESDGSQEYITWEHADEPITEGTPLNKQTLLSDDTATELGLSSEDEQTPNGAFAKLNSELTAVQEEIASTANKEFVTVTLMAANWQQSGDGVYYWQSVSVLGMTDTWIPDSPCFNPDIYGAPENIKWAEVALQVQELAKINAVQSYNGGLNFVCFEETPTWDIYLRVPRLGGRAN